MTEYLHVFTALWVFGTSQVETYSYAECWDMDTLLRQEVEYWTPEGAGELLMTRCEPTQIITAVGFPQLRPEEKQ